MDNYHLTKNGEQWELVKEGSSRASESGSSKEEILKKAHDFLEDKIASLKIHGADGKIQEERTYPRKSDPRKTEG